MQAKPVFQTASEETGPWNRESINIQSIKREWPLKLVKMLFFFVILGGGMVLVLVFALHMSRYIKPVNSIAWCGASSPVVIPERSPRLELEAWLGGPSIRLNMSDEQLLWLASMAPRRQGVPVKRVPKVAFLFLSKGPLPLAPLWERFFIGNRGFYSIYIHTLPGYKLDFPASSAFHGRQIASKETQWGDISMCDSERRLLANALLDYRNERFVLLSETCIPLHSFQVIYDYVIKSHHSFVSAFDDPGPYGRGRYNYGMSPVVKIEQWKKGSQWFEVNRKLAISIVADTVYYPKFRDFCKPACYVDEHYLPTMLTIGFPSHIANRSLTWVDWSRGGPHPAMFGKNDITEQFVRTIREYNTCSYNGHTGSLCFLFGRKFSPNTLDPLLELASEVMGF